MFLNSEKCGLVMDNFHTNRTASQISQLWEEQKAQSFVRRFDRHDEKFDVHTSWYRLRHQNLSQLNWIKSMNSKTTTWAVWQKYHSFVIWQHELQLYCSACYRQLKSIVSQTQSQWIAFCILAVEFHIHKMSLWVNSWRCWFLCGNFHCRPMFTCMYMLNCKLI